MKTGYSFLFSKKLRIPNSEKPLGSRKLVYVYVCFYTLRRFLNFTTDRTVVVWRMDKKD